MAEPSRLALALEYLGGLDAAVAPKLRAVSDAIDPVNVARRAGLNLPTGAQATEAAHFVGPGADIEGMVNDAREGNAAFGRGDLLGALGGYGSAAMAIPMMALPGSVKDVKAGVKSLGEAVEGFRVYHTSPYDFDKFDLNKIGTGEGAQMYGRGMYAADSPAVSGRGGAYDRQFTAKNLGKTDLNQQEEAILRNMTPEKSDADVLYDLHQQGFLAKADDGLPDFDQAEAAIKKIRDAKSKIYEVNIKANPNDFLDWDAPLSSQGENVKKALRDAGVEPKNAGEWTVKQTPSGRWTVYNVWGEPSGSFVSEEAARLKATTGTLKHNEYGGMMAYHKLGGNAAFSNIDKGAASSALSERGIPGIKYLDQGSRAAGDGSHNYVVFDPSKMEILRKYGLAGALMGGAAVAGSTNKEPE